MCGVCAECVGSARRSAQLGLKLTVAIALHNIPEGLAIGAREKKKERERESERERVCV